jgi:hypothetical protein
MFNKRPDQKNIPFSSDLPLKITATNIEKLDSSLYQEIERTLLIDTPSDPLKELYTDVKRSNRFHFYFNNQSAPSYCFPKTEDEKENEKAFNHFSDFLTSALGEQGKETLIKQYEQGKIACITGGILNVGFAKNELISSSKNKECVIHFTTQPSSNTVVVVNQITDCAYIKNGDIGKDDFEKNILHGTLEVKLKVNPDSIEVTSISSNALRILSLVLTKRFKENIPLLDTCTRMVGQCNTQLGLYEDKPLALAYNYIKDKIIHLALASLKNSDEAKKIIPYKQILTDLNNPLYRSAFNRFQQNFIQTKLQLITFKALIDEHVTPENLSKYEAFQQIAKKMEADLAKLQYLFPPDFKASLQTLKEIQTKIAYTKEALTPTSARLR